MDNITQEIKWRGSVYRAERVEGGKVYWVNPVSRHHDSCDIESWNRNLPYGDKYH